MLDTPVVRSFIAAVRASISSAASPEDACEVIRIHLLTNDTGCVWRHAYDPKSGQREPFRSGYVNVPCEEP